MSKQKTKKIVYVDMDETIVDFHSHPTLKIPRDSYNHPYIFSKGYFRDLMPLKGAIDAVNALIDDDRFDVKIATHPLNTSAYCYKEKVMWIQRYLPRIYDQLYLVADKSLLKGWVLIDDDKKWETFEGKFVLFNGYWSDTLKELDELYQKEK